MEMLDFYERNKSRMSPSPKQMAAPHTMPAKQTGRQGQTRERNPSQTIQ